jgi:hypothetical protein
MSDEDFVEFSFDQGDDGVQTRAKKFKGEEGRVYRLSFVWYPGLEDGAQALLKGMSDKVDGKDPAPKFIGAKRHYVPNVGYFIHKGPEYSKLAGGPPKMQVATIVVSWQCDPQGNVTSIEQPPGVMPWIFSADKYDTIKGNHGQFAFGEHDLIAKCTRTQFQNFTFTPAKNNAVRKLIESGKASGIIDHIIDSAIEIRGNIKNEIARDMSIDDIRAKLGGDAGSPVGDVAPATNEQIDNALDGILD